MFYNYFIILLEKVDFFIEIIDIRLLKLVQFLAQAFAISDFLLQNFLFFQEHLYVPYLLPYFLYVMLLIHRFFTGYPSVRIWVGFEF